MAAVRGRAASHERGTPVNPTLEARNLADDVQRAAQLEDYLEYSETFSISFVSRFESIPVEEETDEEQVRGSGSVRVTFGSRSGHHSTHSEVDRPLNSTQDTSLKLIMMNPGLDG